MTRKQVEKHDKRFMKIFVVLAAVLVLHTTITTIRGDESPQEGKRQAIAEQKQQSADKENMVVSTEEIEEKFAVFDGMSEDWGGEEEGFVYYQIPEKFTLNGGYFPEKMQIYTYCLCRQQGVSYPLIVAMIEQESGYRFDRVGDDGNSIGYMQIYESAHTDRMEKMGCTDLLNPFQNVRVGIDYMAELIKKYGTIQDALAAYNYGEKGAREKLWNKGVYLYEYNETILRRMKEIEEELKK